MPDLTLLLQHGILYGAILSVFMVLAFVGAAYLNPEIWLPDYPPDIRERFGPMSERAKRQRRLIGIPVFLLLTGVLVLSSVRLAQIGSESLFFSVFFGTFVVLLVFSAVDLLILDWLVFVTLRPRIVVLPGTEGAEGYGDYGFHFRAFLRGLAGSLIGSLVVAGMATAIIAIVS
jgi:heme/copper-type cytochrome/quinol oxidase subunit 3